jgi:hypothetical protein
MVTTIQKSFYGGLVLLLSGLVLSRWIASISLFYNDDTCVYFNYARNIVIGNWFAYDPRGIPSEGFTSLFFLLLLVPFEVFNINLMFAAVLLNICALILIVVAASWLLYRDRLLSPASVGIFVSVFLGMLTLDTNSTLIVGRALETLLGPATVLLTLGALLAASDPSAYAANTRKGHWLTLSFFLCSFLSYLTRPESIVSLGLCGVFFLAIHPRRGILLWYTAGFVVALVVYHLAKWQIFGDFFPTGFYRKVGSDGALLPGRAYVSAFIESYELPLVLSGLLLGGFWLKGQIQGMPHRSMVLLCIVGVVPLVLFLFSTPLIGYNHRYLINSMVVMYLVLAYAATYMCQVLTNNIVRSPRLWPSMVLLAVMAMVAGAFVVSQRSTQTINIYAKAAQGHQEHVYIQFGQYMREQLPDHERATLAFGDAGCIPYASHVTFIDTNGLTEPYIAHLFQVDDLDTKTKRFSEYVLSWNPDLIVLGYGDTVENAWNIPPNLHSPFGRESRVGVFEAYQQDGFEYICSIRSYSDLHLGVSRDSPRFADIAPAMLEYCEQHGYMLDHLIVRDETGSVFFPRVTLENDTS